MKTLTDICYSAAPHSRSYLDIYLPDDTPHAVFIYFHGGGIEAGSKGFANTDFFLQNRIAVVCPNYRLYPTAKYPEFIEDAAEAAAWVKNNPQFFDGCSNIFIGGSSAGGYLSMMLYFAKDYLGKCGLSSQDFSGFVLDAGQPTTHYNVLRERGQDTRQVVVDEAAPLYHITDYAGEPPVLIFVAENDIPNRFEQTILLRSTMKQFGYPEDHISYHFMPGCNHCSYVGSQEFADAILAFFHTTL